MFTGLVHGLGRVAAVENRGSQSRLRIAANLAIPDMAMGESIAVNGACLTVESGASGPAGSAWFTAYASAETLACTSLGDLRVGSAVNLERALRLSDRLGGHLVSGHIDCLATVVSVTPAGESKIYRLSFPTEHGPFVIPKGSVALDGVSLTVNDCGADFLTVNIIPATQAETTIAQWAPGRRVNMETDLIGKYAQRLLGAWSGKAPSPAPPMDMDLLRRHGF